MSESIIDTTPTNYSQNNQGNDELIQSDSPKSSIILRDSSGSLLGVIYGIGMNVNNVLGSGIVTTPGIIWNSVKSPVIVLILWFIGGLVSMAGSLTYVELGAMHKISGGETKYLQTAYPEPKLMMSYLFSFMFIFAIRPGIISAVLQSAAQYFWYTIAGYQYDKELELHKIGWNLKFSPFWSIKFIAIAILLIITIYHMLSNRWAILINQTLATIKLITYSIIAITGICRLFLNWENSRGNWQEPLDGDAGINAYSQSILLIMFSYDGWNNLNYSLDEFRNPEKKLILSNSISVGIVSFMYLLVNIAFISVVPKGDVLDNKTTNETIAVSFFNQLFRSDAIVRMFTFLIVLSVIGTAAANVWSGSRVIVAAARLKFFPIYSDQLKNWHENSNTPVNALLAQFIWCSLIILFVGSSFTITSFELFSKFAIYNFWVFYLATGIGLFVIRYKKPENNRPFKVWLPITGIFILAGIFILISPLVVECPDKGNECIQQKRSPFYMSYGFLFIALMFWYFLYFWWDTKKTQKKQQTKVTNTNTTPFYTPNTPKNE
ncbi:16363_t:CDS:2 [Funneliformis geosporum]|uniref:17537_t:CDS:1 n=1 Tax=Funneliformis geosporum TaxID=1117311 RepID=A0A9W4X155_9GLOM|nr:17537_t:CDS:2 [Funneliformis geosporum]CAI2185925.1 16363_t:CDS:2 [Funneliformis geosporum]